MPCIFNRKKFRHKSGLLAIPEAVSIEDIGEAIKNLIIARELFPAISPILKEASRSNANNYSRAICYRNPYHDKGGKIKNSERG